MPEEKTTPEKPEKKSEQRSRFVTYAMVLTIAAIFFGIGFLTNGSVTGYAVAGQTGGASEAGQIAVDYINDYMLSGVTATLENTSEENGLYRVNIKIADTPYTSYVSKDGKFLFVQAIDLEETPETPEQQTPPEAPTVTKSDNPTADIFVMSYCPYGLQMMKALVPAWKLLEGKADINLRFVSYIMHDKAEIDENTRMYCIQKEQKTKLLGYLECFTATGESDTCLAQAGVDKAKMDACIAAADEEFSITANYEDESSWLSGRFPLYWVDKELNEQYGIRGSPGVVINGETVSVSRSPDAVKEAICNAFNTPPAECQQALSTAQASPGIGGGIGTNSDGSCG